ncbi:lecithin retinol acyltransferase family protein [Paraburkholderia acidisoli]|uniref:Hydrolase n=1 Tax=Paraburkholderia acidisoli TaxID=2571748 RepID=A0A7Z2GN13_9BURK|nr:lecithin retinol acyltransferase family protein [Paraburkholderia acidisoli]QGZ64708.1 hydrolase [Paraburkholderia acidisoli]
MNPDLQPTNHSAHAAPCAVVRAIDLPLGAHLVSRRAGYSHHGIYAGNGRVVHYAGLCVSLHRGPIEEVTLERFAAGYDVEVVAHPCALYAGREAVARARSRLGEDRYRLLSNNCEHFCTWCVDGKSRSEQVRTCVAHPLLGLRVVRALMLARGRHAHTGRHANGHVAAACEARAA